MTYWRGSSSEALACQYRVLVRLHQFWRRRCCRFLGAQLSRHASWSRAEQCSLWQQTGKHAIFKSAGEPLQCAERNRQTCLLLLHYSALTQQAYLKCSGSLDQPLQTGAITDCAGGGELTCATAPGQRLQPAHIKTIAEQSNLYGDGLQQHIAEDAQSLHCQSMPCFVPDAKSLYTCAKWSSS